MLPDKKDIKKILFITLSNMGDVILTLPVLDYMREHFPESKITVMVGPRPKEVFERTPWIERMIIYDKYARLRDKVKLFFELAKEKYDVVLDLRNTMYGALLPAKYRMSPFLFVPSSIPHMKERNLFRLKRALGMEGNLGVIPKHCIEASLNEKEYIQALLRKQGVTSADKLMVISPSTAGGTRKWDIEKFVELCNVLSGRYKIVLIGAKSFTAEIASLHKRCRNQTEVFNFTAMTTLSELAALLERADLVISADTGTLQLASYCDRPLIGLFGPSDETKYGPWSSRSKIVKKEIFCRPCSLAQCKFGTVACMESIKVDDVLRQIESLEGIGPAAAPPKIQAKRILVIRTDRIGDVLLSTPVFKALRDAYPSAYIAAVVSPYAKEIVDGNPAIDAVITYDKDGKHRNWLKTWYFSRNLKEKKFDLAFILHPTNRMHLISWFAGISRRIGYDRKLSFLLTDRIKHNKQLGEKHELEYTLDLIRYAGVPVFDTEVSMPFKSEAEGWAESFFAQAGILPSDQVLAVHPCASCPSKMWPVERFAQVADLLAEKYGIKVIVVSGAKDIATAQGMVKQMRTKAFFLGGQTSLSQLASLLKRCALFISNDSGPVHVSSAVGTPVISIFGRNQPGLSPLRWRPVGKKDKILHKQIGCVECIAHNCVKSFACLQAITASDVFKTVESMGLFKRK